VNAALTPALSQAFELVSTPEYSVKAYANFRDLETIRPAWDELLDRYRLATTFSTWEWLASWSRTLGADRKPLVLGLFDRFQSLVGMACFSIKEETFCKSRIRVLRMLGDGSGDSDNLDFPAAPGFEDALAHNVLEYLRLHSFQWDMCEWNTLPHNSPVVASFIRETHRLGWSCTESSTVSSAIPLPPTWDDYLAMLPSEEHKNLLRYTKRLRNRYSMEVYKCMDVASIGRCLDALFRLHQGRWESIGEPGSFSLPQRREFYTDLSGALLERACLELWVLELNQEIAAVQFAFRHNDRVFQLQEGYDHTRPTDRVGFVLRGAVIKALIQEGVSVYDFLGGEDPYKKRWATQPGSYRNLRLAPRWSKGGILLKAANHAVSSKEWLRQQLPQSAWSMLRDLNRMRRSLSPRPAL
jgi:CelD/BcsL family acetyltransferase involved in cellulose biosynthesis